MYVTFLIILRKAQFEVAWSIANILFLQADAWVAAYRLCKALSQDYAGVALILEAHVIFNKNEISYVLGHIHHISVF